MNLTYHIQDNLVSALCAQLFFSNSIPSFESSVDPGQLVSDEASCSGSILFHQHDLHALIQDFFSEGGGGGGEGGGGPGPTAKKQSGHVFFFNNLQRGSNGFITEKAILFQGSRGGPTFSRFA